MLSLQIARGTRRLAPMPFPRGVMNPWTQKRRPVRSSVNPHLPQNPAMLVKRNNISRCDSSMILPTTCPSTRRSASTAWPCILLAIVSVALLVTARTSGGLLLEKGTSPDVSMPKKTEAASSTGAPSQEKQVSSQQERESARSILKCEDTHVDCAKWALAGECERNPAFMHGTCPSSCKLCDARAETKPAGTVGLVGGKCADLNARCPDWAKVGECEKNPPFMHNSCRRSCNLCSADA